MGKSKKSVWAAVLSLTLLVGLHAPTALAAPASLTYEEGDDAAILIDLALLRPLGLVATVGGTVIFVASLPISLGSWSVGKAFNALVKRPARYTFVRDLGDPN